MQSIPHSAQAVFDDYFKNTPAKTPSQLNVSNDPHQSTYVPDGLRAKGNIDIEGFTNRLSDLLTSAWGSDWGDFTMEEPTGNDPENMSLPVICFDIVLRKPSQGKIGVKARPTEMILDPENNDYTLILHRQWFDAVVEFLVFHSTNRDARQLSDRFELFIDTYRGFFKEQGVSEMIFQEEVDSRLSKKYKSGVPSTCLRYFIVIERVLVERVKTTKELRSKIQAKTSGFSTDPGLEITSRL